MALWVYMFVLWVMLKEAERRVLIADERETIGAENKVIQDADAEHLLSDTDALSFHMMSKFHMLQK